MLSYIYKCVTDEQEANNSHFKISNSNQGKLDKTRTNLGNSQILDETNDYFLWNIAVDTIKDETSDINFIGKNTFFETLCKCNINIQQIMLNRSSNYHFIYRYQFKRTAKCVYILSIRLRFSGFVAIVINLSRVNIIIVSIKKARSSYT